MEAFVTAMTTALTPAAFWGSIAPFAPIIGVLVLVAFGYGIMRRVVGGASRGKAKFQFKVGHAQCSKSPLQVIINKKGKNV